MCNRKGSLVPITPLLGSNFADWAKDGIPNAKVRFVAQLAGFSAIGGTASRLTGGKFGNGAMTGAFQYLFNCSIHKCWDKYLLYGSKSLLGAAGVLGGSALCASTWVGCVLGAPSVAFNASSVWENVNRIVDLAEGGNGDASNVMVDATKRAVSEFVSSPEMQDRVTTGVVLVTDMMAMRAPVLIVDNWQWVQQGYLLAPLITRSTAWATGNKGVAAANAAVDVLMGP